MRIFNLKAKFYSECTKIFLKIIYLNKIKIGKNVTIRKRLNVVHGENVSIGNNVFFNNDCSINALGKIIIGDDCLFGENVKMYDHNHIFSDLNKPIRKQGMKVGEIIIGNNCWICSNVTILSNVTIGDNVIIGANCLIYKSIPSNTIVKCKSQLEFRTV